MRGASRAALALGCCWLAGAQAQDSGARRGQEREQPAPDLEFFEYLGTWAEEDDEWLAIETWEKDNREDADRDAQKGSEHERDEDDESE